MSSIRHTTQKLIKHGEFQLQRQVVETPNLLQFIGSKIARGGVEAEIVSLTTLRGFAFSMETRKSLIQSFHVLQSLNFRHFPRILAIDSTGPTEDVWVINEWTEARSVREIISSTQQSGRALDPSVAFFILKSLTSALSTLHRCRVSELKTIHGAISPDTVWISANGEIHLYNYFFGLAAGFEQGYTLEEAVDLRGLGETFWTLLTGENWSGPERANEIQLPAGAGIILEACGLTTGDPRRSTRDFTSVLNAVIGAEPYYFSKRYVASWLSRADQVRQSPTTSPSPLRVPDHGKTLLENAEAHPLPSPKPARGKFPRRMWRMAAGVASMFVVLVILFAIWQEPKPVVAPTEGVVSITVEPDVEAVIGDRTYNQATLASVRLTFGDHRIEYRYQGRPIYSESVHVGGGDFIVLQRNALLGEVEFVLVQPPATSAIPIAVQIDGDAEKRDTVNRALVGPGTRRFTFSAPGYQTSSAEADIVSGKTTPVEVRLTAEVKPKEPGPKSEPKMGSLSVDSLLPVQVWNDGKLLGRTTGAGPTKITLPPSSYNLELRYGSPYESKNRKVEVKIDEATPLLDANIYISVKVNSARNSIPEAAKVFLKEGNRPEEELGETPLRVEKVPIGGYLVFKPESGEPQRKLITGTDTIRVDF